MPSPERVAARLQTLWEIARGPAGGADRPAYSEAEARAMRLVAGWAEETGLAPALDRHGNLWAAPPGGAGPLVSSGSHVDTVPDGGRYDGALGTVLALEAAAALPDAAVLVCAAEEAPRFGAGTLGSRSLLGALDDGDLARLHDAAGTSARDARNAFLAELSELRRIDAVPLGAVRAHVEVHVEQRGDLRARGARLGVVERVATPHRHELVVVGRAGHAGEVPMGKRHDALAAAAELVLALEAAACDARDLATVATVGAVRVEPGAVSVIPGRAVLTLEVRGIDAESIAGVEAALAAAQDEVAGRRGVTVERRLLRGGSPVTLDPVLVATALAAAARHGAAAVRTYSGAGHDAQHLAARVPAGLLFVPLSAGESHTPAEEADPADVELAGAVLVEVMGAAR
jgi:hydantoinase/carbamoylase family amidase